MHADIPAGNIMRGYRAMEGFMKCLVFGGNGFIGSAVCDRLLLCGHQVRVFARPKSMPYRTFGSDEDFEFTKGEFNNINDLREAVKGMDIIFHFISSTIPKSANDDPIWDIQSNLIGSLRLLQVVKEVPIKKIIFCSTGGAIYGLPKQLPIAENHPTTPLTAYGITKLSIEKHLLLHSYINNTPTLILRLSNPYGPRQRVEAAQGAVRIFLQRALDGLPIEIWGDGKTIRDYIYISDVATAFASAINYEGIEQVFNLGTGIGISLNELLDAIELLLKHPIKRIYFPKRAFDVPISILDNSRIREAFNWSPEIDLINGLELMLNNLN
jgi:UDP-glucose 4-epimerase